MTKGLILMAGSGRRLLPLTESVPKPLVEIAGRPLLSRSVDALVACGITRIVGVVGYGAEQIERYFRQEYPALSVELIDNARHAETNNAYSLLCAHEAFNASGMILLDGDILYEQEIMESVVALGDDRSGLVVRRSRDLGEEEMKVVVRNGRITDIGKHLDPAASLGESIGIARFSAADTRRLFEVLEGRIGIDGEFYEASFQQMIDEGMSLEMIDAADRLCIEIDTLEDLRVAAREVAPWVDSVVVGR